MISRTVPGGSGRASTSISVSMPAAGIPTRPRTNDRQIIAITRLDVSSGWSPNTPVRNGSTRVRTVASSRRLDR